MHGSLLPINFTFNLDSFPTSINWLFVIDIFPTILAAVLSPFKWSPLAIDSLFWPHPDTRIHHSALPLIFTPLIIYRLNFSRFDWLLLTFEQFFLLPLSVFSPVASKQIILIKFSFIFDRDLFIFLLIFKVQFSMPFFIAGV